MHRLVSTWLQAQVLEMEMTCKHNTTNTKHAQLYLLVVQTLAHPSVWQLFNNMSYESLGIKMTRKKIRCPLTSLQKGLAGHG